MVRLPVAVHIMHAPAEKLFMPGNFSYADTRRAIHAIAAKIDGMVHAEYMRCQVKFCFICDRTPSFDQNIHSIPNASLKIYAYETVVNQAFSICLTGFVSIKSMLCSRKCMREIPTSESYEHSRTIQSGTFC